MTISKSLVLDLGSQQMSARTISSCVGVGREHMQVSVFHLALRCGYCPTDTQSSNILLALSDYALVYIASLSQVSF